VVTRPTTTELLKYFLYLGSLGFGGPVALVGGLAELDLMREALDPIPAKSDALAGALRLAAQLL